MTSMGNKVTRVRRGYRIREDIYVEAERMIKVVNDALTAEQEEKISETAYVESALVFYTEALKRRMAKGKI